MEIPARVTITGVLAISLIVLKFLNKWLATRWAKRIVAKISANPHAFDNVPKPMPESLYLVEVLSDDISCLTPAGERASIKWADLRKVEILTTDHGPFMPDLFWVLHGSQGGCVIPFFSAGEELLKKRLEALPGFNTEPFLSAMSLTSNNLLLCWDADQVLQREQEK